MCQFGSCSCGVCGMYLLFNRIRQKPIQIREMIMIVGDTVSSSNVSGLILEVVPISMYNVNPLHLFLELTGKQLENPSYFLSTLLE